jgi:hypothetical protein
MPREEIERRVAVRMSRQKVLNRPRPLRLWAVIDEAALRRSIGGPDLARDQLDHLLTINEQTNVSIQIAPLSYGGHPAAGGPFTLLRFAQPDLPDIVYLEQLTSALYLDKLADIDQYALAMETLCIEAAPPDRTGALLRQIASELKG